jgi:hypothetical protein
MTPCRLYRPRYRDNRISASGEYGGEIVTIHPR